MLSRCRNLRKALAVTLSFMMVMTMCTFNIPPSYADTGTIELMDPSGSPTGVYYSISDTGVLSFTGSGAIPSYSVTETDPNYYKSAPWQSSYVVDSITRIEINEGITAVGSYAFYKMTSVSSVSFPESSMRS
ncbi:MAG: leucine-rich repeat domain-containing protein, partial [Clostridia bacterium]|nr:leucine-rich repeat domain-containing protein [Clostridia bacterium]